MLVGGGHGHLLVALAARELREVGIEVVLVEPGAFWYSGLATGVLAGMYPPELDRVDVAALCRRHGVRLVRERAVGLDPDARRLRLGSGRTLSYDALSLNLGSEPDTGSLTLEGLGAEGTGPTTPAGRGAAAGPSAQDAAAGLENPDAGAGLASVRRVKPIPDLLGLRQDLEARFRAGGACDVVVIGGGASGSEVAAAADALARRRGGEARVRLVTRAGRLLPTAPGGAARSLLRHLRRRRIRVDLEREAAAVRDAGDGRAEVRLAGGAALGADVVVLATGLRPPRLLEGFGLPLGPGGGLRVDDRMRAVGHEAVFGVGDCVDIPGRQLPRLGVFAVRQAPVLLHNLRATLAGGALRPYEPRRRWLSILNLGDGRGLATWGPLWWRGRASQWLKDRLDRRFLRRLRAG